LDGQRDDAEQVEGLTEEQIALACDIMDAIEKARDWPAETANWFLTAVLYSAQQRVVKDPLGLVLVTMFIAGYTLRGMVEREEVVL
jgi:hypothetical protein